MRDVRLMFVTSFFDSLSDPWRFLIITMPPRTKTPTKSSRPSTSPAPSRPPSASPARKEASPKPSAKKAAAKADEATLTAAAATEPVAEVAAPAATVPETRNGNGHTPISAEAPSSGPQWALPLCILLTIIAIVVGAAVWPDELQLAPRKVTKIGPDAFELDTLKLKASKDGYTGSNLVVFTYNASLKPDCPACTALDSVTGSNEFKSKVANWRHKKVLKMGKILCNNAKQNTEKQNTELCERFSAVVGAGDDRRPVNAIEHSDFVERKMNPDQDGYAGNVLVLFTQESSAKAQPCEPCKKLDALIADPTFERRVAAWRKRGLARIAKVYCNKQIELCERFGVTGSSGNEPGLPHILWFKGGEEQGKYEGGHSTLGNFDKWIFMHAMPHVLWFKHGKEAVVYDGNTSSAADFHKWVVAKEDVAEL